MVGAPLSLVCMQLWVINSPTQTPPCSLPLAPPSHHPLTGKSPAPVQPTTLRLTELILEEGEANGLGE